MFDVTKHLTRAKERAAHAEAEPAAAGEPAPAPAADNSHEAYWEKYCVDNRWYEYTPDGQYTGNSGD